MDSKEDQKPIWDNIMKYILLSIFIIPFVSVMILFSLSNPVFGKTPQFYSVGECLMRTMKNRNLTGNKKFDVVYKECEKKMNVTKTNIIEHKGELVRKYLEKRDIGSLDQNKDRGHMTLPFTETLPPEFWKGDCSMLNYLNYFRLFV